MMELLKIENVRCGYQHREIVHNASLSVAPGEFCALLGLNGCGKTTLMKAISNGSRDILLIMKMLSFSFHTIFLSLTA